MSNINSARLMFFISQILYQSVDYSQQHVHANRENSTHLPKDFILARIGTMISFQVGTLIICVILFMGVYGFVQYFISRKASFLLVAFEYFALPLSLLLICQHISESSFDAKFILLRILPIIIITILLYIRLLFIQFLHNEHKFNEFIYADRHYQVLLAIKIKILVILSNIVTTQILMYFLFSFQLLSTFYKFFVLICYYPEAQWALIITELWGWLSIFQFIVKQRQLPFEVLYLLILVLAYFYFQPGQKLLIILQNKVKRILQKYKKQRKNQYYIYLAAYYIGTQINSQHRYLNKSWSYGFKLLIKLKISDKDYKISQYFETLQKSRTARSIKNQSLFDIQTQVQININNPQQSLSVIDRQQQLKKIQQFENFMQDKQIGTSNTMYSYQDIYFICYLNAEIQIIKPVNVYEIYYVLLMQNKDKNDIFFRIGMDILYNLIKRKIPAKQFMGTHIEQILKYDQFHYVLQKYTKNQQKFYNLTNQTQIDIQRYKQYLDKKIHLKDKIKRLVKVLQFMYPNSQSLILKNYIIERYVNNNQFLSQESLMHQMNKIYCKKTKIINFSQVLLDNQMCIFLSSFLQNRGSIVFYNKNFQNTLQIQSNIQLKVKDILPLFWRDAHEKELQQLCRLQLNYEHDEQKVYYVQSLQEHKLMQAKQLKIIPYFELNSSLYFLVRMKVQKYKQLSIKKLTKKKPSGKTNLSKTNQLLTTSNQPNTNEIENNQLQILGDEKTKVRSKHHIAFKHEIFDDQDHNTVDQLQKIIEIFGNQYLVCTRTRCINFYTRNLLESSVQDKINQEINAVIKIGLGQKNFQTQIFQVSKRKINLFNDIFWKFLGKVLALCLLITASVVGMSVIFEFYGHIISQSILFQMHYHETFVVSVSFQQVLMALNKNFPQNTSYQQSLTQLFIIDSQKVSQIFDDYIKFADNILSMEVFSNTLFRQYQSLDFDSQYNQNLPNKKSILSHLQKYNSILDSITWMINKRMQNNMTFQQVATQSWVFNHFQSLINNYSKLYQNQEYIENIIINKSKDIRRRKIKQYENLYWIFQIIIIIIPFILIFIYWRNKNHIEQVLCKPLNVSQKQRHIFKQNNKQIKQYLQKQKHNNTKTKLIQSSDSQYIAQSNVVMETINGISSTQGLNSLKEQIKIKKNKFIYFHHVVIFTLIFYLLLLLVTNRFMYLSKSQYIVNLSSQLSAYKKFTYLNNQVLFMYQEMLQLIKIQNITIVEKNSKKDRILITKQIVSSIDISQTLNEMLIDPTLKNQVLFGDPCQWNLLCKRFNRKINPYPVELNYFLTNFYKLFNHIAQTGGTDINTDLRFQYLMYETYFSIRSLVQLNNWISNKNHLAIQVQLQQESLWIGLIYLGLIGILLTMIVNSIRLLYQGNKYGRQLLAILPSIAFCQSKVFSFQVNSILYRTNFAKQMPHG